MFFYQEQIRLVKKYLFQFTFCCTMIFFFQNNINKRVLVKEAQFSSGSFSHYFIKEFLTQWLLHFRLLLLGAKRATLCLGKG